jgi:AraC-like DNA-binding protein
MELIKSRKRNQVRQSFLIVEGDKKVEVSSEYALFKTIKTMLKQCNDKTDISIKACNSLENIEISFAKIAKEKTESQSHFQHSTFWNSSELNMCSSDEKFLTKLQSAIKSNIDKSDLSVEFLSDSLGISRVQMYRKCMIILGISPGTYIKKLRIEYAAALLRQNKFRISEIAYNSGFSDPHYFSLCFSKEFGSTPSQWLKSLDFHL